ncbi:oxidoreductase [Chryseobacterium sp. Leaf180]|uniref:Gfo/Idh/MocA family oxidoreductase n=1 Tax=Chryseobacterium sp. Leaf180 TaxID=1736289 RepID=UPI0006FE19CD|nr:Gfo/Idh/MocA family oxidoreductase [Chryseobacterium sp. Leaf180]KQR91944.1 oxidoreductase [Chryseobacterium sp. Leaf180]
MQLVKAGLCAFGMSGKIFHAPFLSQHPGFFLAAIVERTKNESQKLYPDATIYRSVDEMMAADDIDLIIVNTPVQTHFEYVKKALLAGKNVVVEKPFTVNAQEAEEIVKLAEEKNLFVSVYQNRRFDRDYLQVKKILSEKVLGNIKEAEIRFDRFRTEPSGKDHKENPQEDGSGALHDLGSHLIDQAVQLFGVPQKVFADVFSMKGDAFANDYFEVLLFYPNQLRVRLKSSVFTKKEFFAYKIHGDRGSFLQERSDDQENELGAGSIPEYGKDWVKPLKNADGLLHYSNAENQEEELKTESLPGNYMNYYQQIYEHIVFGDTLPSPANEVVENMKIIDAARDSSQQQNVISIK